MPVHTQLSALHCFLLVLLLAVSAYTATSTAAAAAKETAAAPAAAAAAPAAANDGFNASAAKEVRPHSHASVETASSESFQQQQQQQREQQQQHEQQQLQHEQQQKQDEGLSGAPSLFRIKPSAARANQPLHPDHPPPHQQQQQHEHQQQQQQQHEDVMGLSSDSSVSLYMQSDSWELSFDRPEERQYVCRITPAGGACEMRKWSNWPTSLYCQPNECCSKTKCVHGACGGFCSTEWALCSTAAVYYPEFSYGKCSCKNKGHMCPANTTCYDEEGGYGGAYCMCNKGYVFYKGKCREDPCQHVSCSPGVCKSDENLNISCECPEGYTGTSLGIYSSCQMTNICETNPCGDRVAALDCTPLTPTDYTCTCTTGYEVDKSSGKQKCVSKESRLKCADLPCGAEGLDSCEDTAEGFKCTCRSGYRLVDATVGKKCEFQNPCENNICGPPAAVLSCSATESSYSCQCQTGYTLYTGTSSQFCQVESSSGQYDTYVLAGLGAGGLIVVAMLAMGYKNRHTRIVGDELGDPDADVGVAATTTTITKRRALTLGLGLIQHQPLQLQQQQQQQRQQQQRQQQQQQQGD
ncbi:hypothetical protein Emed_002170 [Eimeria media]